LSGFFSKDEILAGAYGHNRALWLMGLFGAGLTALYMTRLMGLTFFGESRVDHHVEEQIHEVPAAMKWVLVTLAVLTVGGGLLGIPGHHFLERWLEPVFGQPAEGQAGGGSELVLAALSVGMGMVGIGTGLYFYYRGKGERADAVAERAAGVYRLLKNKWFVDELYDATVLRLYYKACDLSARFDTRVVDGVVNRSADFLEASAGMLKLFQTGLVRNYALFFLLGVASILWAFFS
jgi:NADH-quinone oxidoreductase subunit L